MKTRKTITLILISMMLLISLGCQRSPERQLIGTWEGDVYGLTTRVIFNTDGTVLFTVPEHGDFFNEEGTFSVRGNALTTIVDGEAETLTFEFRDRDTLLLEDDGMIFVLRRIR